MLNYLSAAPSGNLFMAMVIAAINFIKGFLPFYLLSFRAKFLLINGRINDVKLCGSAYFLNKKNNALHRGSLNSHQMQ